MRLNISHRFIKAEKENKIDVNTDKTIIGPEIGHTVGIKKCLIGAGETMIGPIDLIIEVEQEITIDMIIGETAIDKMIDVVITDKTIKGRITRLTIDNNMEETIIGNRDTGLEVKVGIILEITTEITQGKDLSEVEIQIETEV